MGPKHKAYQKDRMRRTTFTISPAHWEWLEQKERRTGVKPSVIVRRAIDAAIREDSFGVRPVGVEPRAT